MSRNIRIRSVEYTRSIKFEQCELYSDVDYNFQQYYYRVVNCIGTVFWMRLDYILVDPELHYYLENIYKKLLKKQKL